MTRDSEFPPPRLGRPAERLFPAVSDRLYASADPPPARRQGRPTAAARAVALAAAAPPPGLPADPREPQVRAVLTLLAAAPDRRARDEAYERLTAAAGAKDEPAVVVAAFLARLPAEATDPRAEQVRVAFAPAGPVWAGMTDWEKDDQLRDWVPYAVVRGLGLSADQMARARFDVPPVRHGYLRPVAGYEYGVTRSCLLDGGAVLAVAPKADDKQRRDHLAHVADDARKTLGRLPMAVRVVEYEFDRAALRGGFTRLPDVPGGAPFTAECGYHAATTRRLDDLTGLMARVEDMAAASLDRGVLTVGGRKHLARAYRTITVAEVAALWKADRASADRLRQLAEEVGREFDARWGRLLDGQLAPRMKADVQAAFAKAVRERGLVSHLGFSLDTKFFPDRLSDVFTKTTEPRLAVLLRDEANPSFTRAELDAAKAALGRRDDEPLLRLTHRLSREDNRNPRERDAAMDLGDDLLAPPPGLRFQTARYDGDLHGTEVGMVLFYTDLLNKLWAMNLGLSTPRTIADFRPETDTPINPVFELQAARHSSTRIGFGPNDGGFNLSLGRRPLVFARNATRLFSAASEALSPREEVAPNPSSELFDGGWNDHYAEVAGHEPECERLNQVIKWSLVVSWLGDLAADDRNLDRAPGRGSERGRRGAVPFRTDHWFPDRVTAKPLKLQAWDEIRFDAKADRVSSQKMWNGPVPVESLPVPESKPTPTSSRGITGGVQLGGRSLLRDRTPLPTNPLLSGGRVRTVTPAGNLALRFGRTRTGSASGVPGTPGRTRPRTPGPCSSPGTTSPPAGGWSSAGATATPGRCSPAGPRSPSRPPSRPPA
jgi:hypothetical protein